MIASLRRLRCNLRPDWHRGFVSREMVLPPQIAVLSAATPGGILVGGELIELRPSRGVSGVTQRYWTRPRCVDCGELE